MGKLRLPECRNGLFLEAVFCLKWNPQRDFCQSEPDSRNHASLERELFLRNQSGFHCFGQKQMVLANRKCRNVGRTLPTEFLSQIWNCKHFVFPWSRCAVWRSRFFLRERKTGGIRMKANIRNEIKAQIIRAGFTMQEVVDLLHDEYGWSDSVSNLSAKLQRESLRYKEAVELADALGYDIEWVKRRES